MSTSAAAPGLPEEARTFFAGSPAGLEIGEAVFACIRDVGPCEVRVTKSQIAFRHGRGFAYLWRPAMYVTSSVPAVLSLALPYRLASARFKEVVQPAAGRWMHHLELPTAESVDTEVRHWLRLAFEAA
ncbi:DUF5655 domain-containing protein [Paenarthrobacter ureafaciens]